jgi:hypothetical protein
MSGWRGGPGSSGGEREGEGGGGARADIFTGGGRGGGGERERERERERCRIRPAYFGNRGSTKRFGVFAHLFRTQVAVWYWWDPPYSVLSRQANHCPDPFLGFETFETIARELVAPSICRSASSVSIKPDGVKQKIGVARVHPTLVHLCYCILDLKCYYPAWLNWRQKA